MLFTRPPLAADDIRAFCARFNEGLRVEYKANLDNAVRGALPKVISSFANSLGGVVVLGVNAVNGVPQEPIEGFVPPEREELALTIENISLQNLHPPVFPRITEVPGGTPDRRFLVLEIDQSVEAPHAIENSTRVHVRTGNAANPYELANVDKVIELLRRREDPTERRRKLIESIHIEGIHGQSPRMQAVLCPIFPSVPLCTVEECWEFLTRAQYRATASRFFQFEMLRRVENGVAAFVPEREFHPAECGEVNRYGLVSETKKITTAQRNWGGMPDQQYLVFHDVFQNWVKIYMCACAFYEEVGFKGDVLVQIGLTNMKTRSLPFIGFTDRSLDDFRSYDNEISASHVLAAANLATSVEAVTHQLLSQLCWAVWQGPEDFPSHQLNTQTTLSLRALRAIP